jgi:hypothetical protein
MKSLEIDEKEKKEILEKHTKAKELEKNKKEENKKGLQSPKKN